ncbi:hypothetical protein [Streptomyces sp. NPDC057257]|uniref:hypothetical protein n=1 Tax=Streptomyces sp. NPDC057257 TaxID=3346071 RepID=UPI0036365ADB
MPDTEQSSPARDQIAAVIRDFPFDDYGLDNVSFLLEDSPETQEWVPALRPMCSASSASTSSG